MKSSLLASVGTQTQSHKQEKQNMRTSYRQSVNRFKVKKTKTGSAGGEKKKAVGARGKITLVLTSTGRRTWKRLSFPVVQYFFPKPDPFSVEEAWEDVEREESR